MLNLSNRQRCRSLAPLALAATLAAPTAAHAGRLLPAPGPWPVAVPDATNPLINTAFAINGRYGTPNAKLRAWLAAGHAHRSTIARVAGRRAVVRGQLDSYDVRQPISGARVTLVAQNVYTGAWNKVLDVSTSRKGRFHAVLPAGLTSRVAILYWPTVSAPGPVPSRRLTIKTSARVFLSAHRLKHRRISFRGRVSGAPIPPAALRVAVQARNRAGRWVTLRLPLTATDGRFHVIYRFADSNRYVVRALAPSQADWPLFAGHSQRVAIGPR